VGGAAAEALTQVLSISHLLWMLVGVGVGMVVGVVPGLGGAVGMSLLLPFLFGMDSYDGMALLVGMAAVVQTTDTIPSVLMGIPGSSASQATVLDGYPMSKKGLAGVALGAAFMASMMGGIIGAISLVVTVTAIRPIVLALNTTDLLMFSILGLSMVAVLARGSALRGLAAASIGLVLGSIGLAPQAAEIRYTFGAVYLIDGIPIILVALGLFAFPEMVDLLVGKKSIAGEGGVIGGRMEGLRAALRHRWLVLRSALLGTTIGILPGLGGSVVDWMAYGLARTTVKDSHTFGSGDVRGVIAPESANNALTAGALVPTLIFGIPGSPTTAILLAGLLLLGIQAGPDMVGVRLPLTLSVVWTLAVANIFATVLCFGLTKQIARISTIRPTRLVPFLYLVMIVAAYQASFAWGDVLVFIGLGLLSLVMKYIGWPRAPLLIGYILAPVTERYLFVSMSRYDLEWLFFPRVMIFGAITLLIIIFGARGGKGVKNIEFQGASR
jgi:putative tricarboxylic transport membrane protein